jgi:hypothetical protein
MRHVELSEHFAITCQRVVRGIVTPRELKRDRRGMDLRGLRQKLWAKKGKSEEGE